MSEIARCSRTQVHGMIPFLTVLFQAVLGHLVNSRGIFLPDYNFLNVLHKSGFSICGSPTVIPCTLLPVPLREPLQVKESILIGTGKPCSPIVPHWLHLPFSTSSALHISLFPSLSLQSSGCQTSMCKNFLETFL